jgi:hypothetical protein
MSERQIRVGDRVVDRNRPPGSAQHGPMEVVERSDDRADRHSLGPNRTVFSANGARGRVQRSDSVFGCIDLDHRERDGRDARMFWFPASRLRRVAGEGRTDGGPA